MPAPVEEVAMVARELQADAGTVLHRDIACEPYERHRPEQTPLYALVEEHFPRFLQRLEDEGVSLPHFVREEFEAYLECGRLEYGFLRVKCDACRHEKLVAFSARLAALVPRPRAHLTRYHGVFAPNFKHRHRVVPNPLHPRASGVSGRAHLPEVKLPEDSGGDWLPSE